MKLILAFLLLIAASAFGQVMSGKLALFGGVQTGSASSQGGGGAALGPDDEFVGPFASWFNVKTGMGAVGDGLADDTDAIQQYGMRRTELLTALDAAPMTNRIAAMTAAWKVLKP